jgi:hypothetical protein
MGPTWFFSWTPSIFDGIDAKKHYYAPTKDPNYSDSQFQSYSVLLSSVDPVGLTDSQGHCFLGGLETFIQYRDQQKNTSFPGYKMYQKSMQYTDWVEDFDQGEFRKQVEFDFSYKDDNGTNMLSFQADSVTRVDITPTNWLTQGLLWNVRNARTTQGGLCKDGMRISECYFGTHGYWNTITTGMVVMSNLFVKTKTIFPNGGYESGNTTSPKDAPFVVAWVVDLLPAREPFCPCFNGNRTAGLGCVMYSAGYNYGPVLNY